jgi:hypothetical protein
MKSCDKGYAGRRHFDVHYASQSSLLYLRTDVSPFLTIILLFSIEIALTTILQYFLDNYIFTPPPSSCLFYTFDLTAAAQNYSKGERTS